MRSLRLLLLSLAVGLVCSSCGKKRNPQAESAEAIPLFQEKKGIWLPDEMKKAFGVEVAEVAEQPIQREIHKLARVYREARGGSPAGASAMLATAEMKNLKAGHAVGLKTAASDEEVSGSLKHIDEQTQSAFGQNEALIEFADPHQRFAAGAFLTARFVLDESKPAMGVPKTSLLTAAEGTFVYVLNGEHFIRTKIRTGMATDTFVEVEDGLYSGDMVVTKGVESLWLIELSALKGGKPCCAVPRKQTASAK